MEALLTFNQTRVLGSLIEKQLSTPEYYPMTLNALLAACNQKSNRDPVVSYDEQFLVRIIDSLQMKNLVIRISSPLNRVPKYEHGLQQAFRFSVQELAIMSELMLRGAQTLSELRTHASRMYEFSSIEEVEATIEQLTNHAKGALITKLPRQPGQKEMRYAHLLSGEPKIQQSEAPVKLEIATQEFMEEKERFLKLETEVKQLRLEIEQLKEQFIAFKAQFE